MIPETLLTICTVATMVGGIVIVAAGYGSTQFSRKIQQRKDEEHAETRQSLSDRIDELLEDEQKAKDERASISAQLKPFEDFAKQKYPNVSLGDALGKLRQDLGKLDQRTSSLEATVAQRSLGTAEMAKLASALSTAGTGIKYWASSPASDNEARTLLGNLAQALEIAGWELGMTVAAQGQWKGIQISAKPHREAAARALVEALHGVGLVATCVGLAEGTPEILIAVGSK